MHMTTVDARKALKIDDALRVKLILNSHQKSHYSTRGSNALVSIYY